MKYVIIIVPLLLLTIGTFGQGLPNSINVYYYNGDEDTPEAREFHREYGGHPNTNRDPWGWESETSIPASEIIENSYRYIEVRDTCTIKMLLPENVNQKIDTTWKADKRDDSRFVLLLHYPEKTDTISLPSMADFHIRYNTSFCFLDSDYYKTVVSYIAKKDRKFRKWYKQHYYDGEFHFFLDE